MSQEQLARRASMRLTIAGHDATSAVAPSLTEFSYTDNLTGKADEVQITLQDREGRWNGPWKPEKGMEVTATLTVQDWTGSQETASLDCGSFKIDEITLDGPPDTFKVKAVSASLTTGLRDEAKTRAWENQSFKGIAEEVAGEHGLALHYDGADYQRARIDQREEADLAFVNRLAVERALCCKVHDGKLVLADSVGAEQRKTSYVLSREGGEIPVTRYSFKQSSSRTNYSKAEAAYTDPTTGEVHTATAQIAPQEREQDEKAMQLNSRVESSGEAMRLAGSSLHNANKDKDKATVDCMGHPGLVAGLTVTLSGFGDFSGAYLIEKATHKIGGSGGYTMGLELRKCRLAPDVRMSSGSVPVAKNVPGQKPAPPTPPVTPPNPTEHWAQLFASLRDFWLTSRVDKLTELLLCLPDIAESMADNAGNADDAKGWRYLEAMFLHWFGGNDNKGNETAAEPFWVEWDWVMRFKRAELAYDIFTGEVVAEPRHIVNENAFKQLAAILQICSEHKKENFEFDFIATGMDDWKTLQGNYHTEIAVPRGKKVDGLHTALAAFSLRALAKGHVEYKGDNTYIIHVDAIAVFVRDKFQFEQDSSPAANELGWWSCGALIGGVSSPEDKEYRYFWLENKDFRVFREKYHYGGDFLVLSKPHIVENFTRRSYEITCP